MILAKFLPNRFGPLWYFNNIGFHLRNNAKWIDGTNTYFKKLFEDYYYQGRIVYTIQDAKDLLEGGAPGVIARPQGWIIFPLIQKIACLMSIFTRLL